MKLLTEEDLDVLFPPKPEPSEAAKRKAQLEHEQQTDQEWLSSLYREQN